MAKIDVLFKIALQKKASDLYLISNKYPAFRVEGKLKEIRKEELMIKPRTLHSLVMEILSTEQKATLQENRDLDISYSVNGYRFRLNIHYQSGNIALAARSIPKNIKDGKELMFQDVLYDITNFNDGLVLVTGPSGAGKSSVIAAMVDYIHQKRTEHIITLEDPIEFVFGKGKSIIEQREIGSDTPNFAKGLKHVLRQDPDIIVIGEMRDVETLDAALNAAETGHLVFSTLHTYSASQTIERIIAMFSADRQEQVLTQLSASLRAVVSQHLVSHKDGGNRVPIREIMINNPAIGNLIRLNKINQIPAVIQTNRDMGMMTMEHSAKKLVKNGMISKDSYNHIMNYYLN